jgi:DNA-3-methyladenine glycosylase I
MGETITFLKKQEGFIRRTRAETRAARVPLPLERKAADAMDEMPGRALVRCAWAHSPLAIGYHDEEWGVPDFDDQRLFEFLSLEGAQAGLSWETILKKRQHYRAAFANFQIPVVASYGPQEVEQLLGDPGIVRNRAKIHSVIHNAQAVLAIQQEYGSFCRFIWQFVGQSPKINQWRTLSELPATTVQSDEMSKALKRRGFSFIGSTICYAFMQATGMVNDHTIDCFRYEPLARLAASTNGPEPAQQGMIP